MASDYDISPEMEGTAHGRYRITAPRRFRAYVRQDTGTPYRQPDRASPDRVQAMRTRPARGRAAQVAPAHRPDGGAASRHDAVATPLPRNSRTHQRRPTLHGLPFHRHPHRGKCRLGDRRTGHELDPALTL